MLADRRETVDELVFRRHASIAGQLPEVALHLAEDLLQFALVQLCSGGQVGEHQVGGHGEGAVRHLKALVDVVDREADLVLVFAVSIGDAVLLEDRDDCGREERNPQRYVVVALDVREQAVAERTQQFGVLIEVVVQHGLHEDRAGLLELSEPGVVRTLQLADLNESREVARLVVG